MIKSIKLSYKKFQSEHLFSFIALGLSIALYLKIILLSSSGIDFTDEGFYLTSMANPELYPASVSLFGFIYHPLFKLCGGSISLVRQLNCLITLLLGMLLAANLFKEQNKLRFSDFFIGFTISTVTLVLQDFRLPTPSYNTLTLQGAMIASLGLVFAFKTKPSPIVPFLIGIGGTLTFLSKPTSAFGLCILFFLMFFVSRRISLKTLLLSSMYSLLFLLAASIVIDGLPLTFIQRFWNGYHDVKAMGGGHKIMSNLNLSLLDLSFREKTLFICTSSIVFIATHLSTKNRHFDKKLKLIFFTLTTLTILTLSGYNLYFPFFSRFIGMQITSVLFGMFALWIFTKRFQFVKDVDRDFLVLLLFFLILPFVYSTGTTRNIWMNAQAASIFWILAGVLLYKKANPKRDSDWRGFLPAAFVLQLLVSVCVYSGIQWPYRQELPLNMNRKEIRVSGTDSKLLVSEPIQQFVEAAQKQLSAGGFKSGDSMIDMTGRYPGLLYLLGAKATGLPWMIGGYPGSEELATRALKRTPHSLLHSSWILVEPDGERSISLSILNKVGIDFEKNYQKTVIIPLIPDKTHTEHQLVIYKPRKKEDS